MHHLGFPANRSLNYRWFSFSCLSLFFVCFEVSPIRLLVFLLLCPLFSMLDLSFFFSDASCLTLRVNLLRPRSPLYGCILVANTYFWGTDGEKLQTLPCQLFANISVSHVNLFLICLLKPCLLMILALDYKRKLLLVTWCIGRANCATLIATVLSV